MLLKNTRNERTVRPNVPIFAQKLSNLSRRLAILVGHSSPDPDSAGYGEFHTRPPKCDVPKIVYKGPNTLLLSLAYGSENLQH